MRLANIKAWVATNCRFAFDGVAADPELQKLIGRTCIIHFWKPLDHLKYYPNDMDQSKIKNIGGRKFIPQPTNGTVQNATESALWVKTEDGQGMICVQKGQNGWEATNSAIDPWGGHPKVTIQ